jgi:formate/nitrite transporter FocA (FNT family)
MKKKIIGSIMCGMYIAIGATGYVALRHISEIGGAFFFTVGILMVSSFYNMLVTRVFTLYPFREEYKITDIFIALFGNLIGCIAYSGLLSLTRFGNAVRIENLEAIVGLRLEDTWYSLLILAIICGFLVGCACLTVKAFPDNRVASLGLSSLFIATFVITVPEHIVADYFFFSYYSFTVGFEWKFIPILAIVAVGNVIGCMGTGYLDYYRRKTT